MKAELYMNGPISCGIEVTDKFVDTYKAGEVYKEYIAAPKLNHEISVVGWGKNQTSGEEYWIARNSWGNYWGEYGFFMVPMGDKTFNLGIQTDCTAGIPSFTQKPDNQKEPRVQEFIQ
jgi:cathepsin X